MSGGLRTPFLIVAIVAAVLVFAIEIGANWLPAGTASTDMFSDVPGMSDLGLDNDQEQQILADGSDQSTPGMGIPDMAVLDGLLLLTLALIGTGVWVPQGVQGRVQGIVTLIGSIVALIVGIVLLITTFVLLLTMIGLFLAVPFGTLAYLAIWGFFNRGGATATLSILMFLKLGAGVCLILAQQRFLQNKGLVLILLTSLLANVVVVFLQGLVPVPLVSITDAVAALIVLILGLIWAIVLLVGALISVIKVLRGARTG
jgi:hypothetical protein